MCLLNNYSTRACWRETSEYCPRRRPLILYFLNFFFFACFWLLKAFPNLLFPFFDSCTWRNGYGIPKQCHCLVGLLSALGLVATSMFLSRFILLSFTHRLHIYILMGHFRVHVCLLFKASLSAKFL